MATCDVVELNRKLKILLRRNRYSQTEVGQHLGISQAQVSTWVTGKSKPDLKEALALARLLGVSMEFLVDDDLDEEAATVDQERDVLRAARRLGYEVAMDRLLMAPKLTPKESAPTETRPAAGGGKTRDGRGA